MGFGTEEVALEFIGLVGSATEANQVLPKLGQEGSIVPLGLRPTCSVRRGNVPRTELYR
jgi:hypothetical protein